MWTYYSEDGELARKQNRTIAQIEEAFNKLSDKKKKLEQVHPLNILTTKTVKIQFELPPIHEIDKDDFRTIGAWIDQRDRLIRLTKTKIRQASRVKGIIDEKLKLIEDTYSTYSRIQQNFARLLDDIEDEFEEGPEKSKSITSRRFDKVLRVWSDKTKEQREQCKRALAVLYIIKKQLWDDGSRLDVVLLKFNTALLSLERKEFDLLRARTQTKDAQELLGYLKELQNSYDERVRLQAQIEQNETEIAAWRSDLKEGSRAYYNMVVGSLNVSQLVPT